jgi:hypothetical protein
MIIKQQIVNQLYEQNKFDIPKSLLKAKKDEDLSLKNEELKKKIVIEILMKEIIKKKKSNTKIVPKYK